MQSSVVRTSSSHRRRHTASGTRSVLKTLWQSTATTRLTPCTICTATITSGLATSSTVLKRRSIQVITCTHHYWSAAAIRASLQVATCSAVPFAIRTYSNRYILQIESSIQCLLLNILWLMTVVVIRSLCLSVSFVCPDNSCRPIVTTAFEVNKRRVIVQCALCTCKHDFCDKNVVQAVTILLLMLLSF